jgi:hypothetical protein
MAGLQYDDVPSAMLDLVPEFRGEYEDWLELLEEPLNHILLGSLVSFAEKQWQAAQTPGSPARDVLWRVSQFMEQLAGSEDEKVQNLLHVSYLEGLINSGADDVRAGLVALMLPKTRRLFERVRDAASLLQDRRSNPNAFEPDVFGGDGNADLDPESDTDYNF